MRDGQPTVERIGSEGYAVLPGLFDTSELALMDDAADYLDAHAREKGGGRNLFQKAPGILALFKKDAVLGLMRGFLGPGIGISEGVYLNKDRDANWLVAWHQDLFISVKEKSEAAGYHSWTEKQGIPYVQPPAEVLGKSLWLRVNLDDNDAGNGCLRVSPGTHLQGKIALETIPSMIASKGERAVLCQRGESILFRPLLLHASSKSATPSGRRVLQVLYSGFGFDNGLAWPY